MVHVTVHRVTVDTKVQSDRHIWFACDEILDWA